MVNRGGINGANFSHCQKGAAFLLSKEVRPKPNTYILLPSVDLTFFVQRRIPAKLVSSSEDPKVGWIIQEGVLSIHFSSGGQNVENGAQLYRRC